MDMCDGKYSWTMNLKHGDDVLVRDHLGHHWFSQTVEWQYDGIVGIVFHNALGERGGAYEFDREGIEMGDGARPNHQYARMKMVKASPGNMHRFRQQRKERGDPHWEEYSVCNTSHEALYVLTNTFSPVSGGYRRKYLTQVLGASFNKESLYRVMLDRLKTRMAYITSDRVEETVISLMRGRPLNFTGGLTLYPIMEEQALIGFTFEKKYRIRGFADIIRFDTYQISICKDYPAPSAPAEHQGGFPWDNDGIRKNDVIR